MRPSSMPRAAPIMPNEKTANHSFQFRTSLGSSPSLRRKMLTGFFPAPMLGTVGNCCGVEEKEGEDQLDKRHKHSVKTQTKASTRLLIPKTYRGRTWRRIRHENTAGKCQHIATSAPSLLALLAHEAGANQRGRKSPTTRCQAVVFVVH